jgi:hypothetical protein
MRMLIPFAAGAWLLTVGLQGLSFLVWHGLLPLPAWIGRLDFTPVYPLVAGLVLLAALAGRFMPRSGSEPAPAPIQTRRKR